MSGGQSPFQQVIDDLTDGCGCACHTGLGYNASCQHCWPPSTHIAPDLDLATRAAQKAILARLNQLGVHLLLGEQHTETLAAVCATDAMQAGYAELKRATRRSTADGRGGP